MRTSLPPGAARCWHVDLAHVDDSDVDGLARLLPRSEIERVERYGRLLDRKRTITAHGALRLLMRGIAGVRPDSIVIERTAQGKPKFTSGDYAFNISHSGDKVLLVIARGGEVGIDVERIRDLSDIPGIIRQFFHADEVRELVCLPKTRLSEAFFRLWVCKEAIAKSLGLGLALDMSTYRVIEELNGPRLTAMPEPWTRKPWSLQALPLPVGYAAAIAAPWDMKVIGCHPLLPGLLLRNR